MDNLNINLKDCPFCGGRAVIFVSNGITVQCKNCGCRTPSFSDGIVYGDGGGSIKRVIDRWNSRTERSE